MKTNPGLWLKAATEAKRFFAKDVRRELVERAVPSSAFFEHARMIFDGLPIATMLVRSRHDDFVIIDVNDALLDLAGVRREQLLDRDARALPIAGVAASEWNALLEHVHCTGGAAARDVGVGEHEALRVRAYEPRPGVIAVLFERVACLQPALSEQESRCEAERRRDEFLAALSHELRNPLAPIKNSLRILERSTPGSDAARRATDVIERQVDQLARLVDDLLDVARITRNRIQMKPKLLDLGALVQRAADDYRSVFAKSGVALFVIPAGEPLYVHGDATRLSQVFGNLLQNAAKFTPRGGRATLDVAREGDTAVVAVRDTGAGMDRETLQRIFEPFVQGDTTLARTRGGLGLGLSLAKGLIELHRGSVEAHSEGPGCGAELFVRLPLAEPGPTTRTDPPPCPAITTTRRVLIVEDNLDAAESLKEALELDGHDVKLAHSGSDGVGKARQFRPDVILCDIGLPEMDGYEVARTLRNDAALVGTTIVALSGYALPEDVERAKLAGFDRHLAKPPDMDALEKLLRDAKRRA